MPRRAPRRQGGRGGPVAPRCSASASAVVRRRPRATTRWGVQASTTSWSCFLVLRCASRDLVPRSFRAYKDVLLDSGARVIVQASGRDPKDLATRVEPWKRRPADAAERLASPAQAFPLLGEILTLHPAETPCGCEEHCVGRGTRRLPTKRAMALADAAHLARDFEPNSATEAAPSNHSRLLRWFPEKSPPPNRHSKTDWPPHSGGRTPVGAADARGIRLGAQHRRQEFSGRTGPTAFRSVS